VVQRPTLRALAAFAAISTTLLLSAPAQATWTDPGPTDATWKCGATSYLTELRFDECVRRNLTAPDTESVQSVMLVTNTGTTARPVSGNTETFAGPGQGYHLSYGDCGATVIADRGHRWCYGQGKTVPKGTPIYGKGELFQGSEYSFAYSPTPFDAPIPPPPPGPVEPPKLPDPCIDCDADGSSAAVDCADDDPGIHPGAMDVPGNGADEDCSGRDASIPALETSVAFKFFRHSNRRYTTVRRLVVQPAPAGSTIRLRCSGGGCPFKTKTRAVTRKIAKLNLLPLLRHAKLQPRARLEVQVTKPGTIGRSKVFTMRSNGFPRETDRCMTSGGKPGKCSQ
jgi:hypothetical protein